MTTKTISINRAPVLTLCAAVVAERLGFDEEEALSMGRVLAGLNAQSKGRRLRIPDLDGQRRHFFPACLGESLPFCSFFRRLGYLMAGFLTIRRSFFAMPAPRSGEAAACRPVRPTPIARPSLVEFSERVTAPPYSPITLTSTRLGRLPSNSP